MSDKLDFDHADHELGAGEVQPLIFLLLDFFSWPVFLHTGVGYITWGGEDWLGAGHIGTIKPIRESIGWKPSRFELSLAPVATEYVYDALYEPTWGRLVEMYLGTWRADSVGFVNGREPTMFFRGTMGPPRVALGPRESEVSMEVTDVRNMLDRVNGLRATLLEHQEEASGDKFYELLPQMLDHKFVFNGEEDGGPSTQRFPHGVGDRVRNDREW